jgi:glutathionylspermidine synthase
MVNGLSLVPIPPENYNNYRLEVIFRAYKWDPQVSDVNTVADHILLISQEEARRLEDLAEQLSAETMQIEEALWQNPALAAGLGIPLKALARLKTIKDYRREEHVRLMRFDFHPAGDGWAVSEVNSDVPAGTAEASVLAELAGGYFKQAAPRGNVVESILNAYAPFIRDGAAVAFVHATSYEEDRQVLQCIGDAFERRGITAVYAAPNQLGWIDNKPYSLVDGYGGEFGGIIRYFPAEWLSCYPGYNWAGYFTTHTPSCNHPIALYSQSKRVPLIWDKLGLELPAWRGLLPATTEARIKDPHNQDWVFKPAMGRVGEGVGIRETLSEKEYGRIIKAARRHPKNWVSQKRFSSVAVSNQEGEKYHLCVGVFTVNGKAAGFYGRASKSPRVDEEAIDIPILVRSCSHRRKMPEQRENFSQCKANF